MKKKTQPPLSRAVQRRSARNRGLGTREGADTPPVLRPLCLEGPRGEQKTDGGSRFLQLVPGWSVVPGACQVEEATSAAPTTLHRWQRSWPPEDCQGNPHIPHILHRLLNLNVKGNCCLQDGLTSRNQKWPRRAMHFL